MAGRFVGVFRQISAVNRSLARGDHGLNKFFSTTARMDYGKYLTCTVKDGIAVVKFDEKDAKVNTLNRGTMTEFQEVYKEVTSNPNVKGVVIMSGKADCFIAGADINMISECKNVQEATAISRNGQEMFNLLENLKVPVVAAINGVCLGGGLETALACHYRIAVLKDTMTSTDSCYNDQDKGGVEKMIGEQLTILRTSLENNESEDNQEMRNRQQEQLQKEDSQMYNNNSNISQVVVAPTANIGLYNEATHTTSLTSAQAIPPMFTVPLPVNFYAPPPVNIHLPTPVNNYAPPPVNISFPPPGYPTMPSNYFPTGAQNFSVPPPPLSFPSSSPDSQSFTQTHDPFVPPTFLTASQNLYDFPKPSTNFENFNVPPPPILSQVSSATNAASYPFVPATDNTTTKQAPVKKVVPKMSIVDTRLMGND